MPVDLVRSVVAAPLRRTFGEPTIDFARPVGDPGLFGPGSVAWRVHGDAASMLIGGISALMLQTLHPGAMAGVADHSNYRDDPFGRLRRTGTFVAGTTFASTPVAERLVSTVRKMHKRVVGVRPDGVPYTADDPALLTWVHVAEVGQFLRSYQRFGPGALSADEVDRYYDEVSRVALRLGAPSDEIPRSAAEVRAYYRRVRGDLVYGEQAKDAMRWILEPKGANLAEDQAYVLLSQAAIALLPHWARRMLRLFQPLAFRELTVVPTAKVAATVLRWALGPSPVVTASLERAHGASRVHTS